MGHTKWIHWRKQWNKLADIFAMAFRIFSIFIAIIIAFDTLGYFNFSLFRSSFPFISLSFPVLDSEKAQAVCTHLTTHHFRLIIHLFAAKWMCRNNFSVASEKEACKKLIKSRPMNLVWTHFCVEFSFGPFRTFDRISNLAFNSKLFAPHFNFAQKCSASRTISHKKQRERTEANWMRRIATYLIR